MAVDLDPGKAGAIRNLRLAYVHGTSNANGGPAAVCRSPRRASHPIPRRQIEPVLALSPICLPASPISAGMDGGAIRGQYTAPKRGGQAGRKGGNHRMPYLSRPARTVRPGISAQEPGAVCQPLPPDVQYPGADRWNPDKDGKMRLKVVFEGIVGAAAIAGSVLLSPLLRRWYSRWGATDDELSLAIPGDELVPRPKSQITMAITVKAPAASVWPWFVQLGCQRAGWYSYDLLDNAGIPSADRILPEHQQLEVGDIVKAMPKGDLGFPVAIIQPNRQLTLAGTMNTTTGEEADPNDPDLEAYFSGNQTFVLQEIDEQTTRLIFRMRIDWNPSLLGSVGYKGFLEPISFVMGRKTLLNVRRRAEAATD